MNTVSPKRKEAILKTLAIVGFFVIIGFIAWASVKVVSLAPSAFSSLASLAEGIKQYEAALGENDENLAVVSDQTEVISGKPTIISWTKDKQDGTYSFSYECIEGVRVAVVEADGLRDVACGVMSPVGDTEAITIVPESALTDPTILRYQIQFAHSADETLTRQGSAEIVLLTSAVVEAPDPVLGSEDQADFSDNTPAPTPSPAPTPVSPTPTTPEYTYTFPVSDPRGVVDLGTLFRGSGDIKNGKFVAGAIERNSDGAFQFEVKNYGTKTSEKWSYSVTLPDGDTYTSPAQDPLKPTERVIITLGFPVDNDSSHTFTVTLKVTNDMVSTNNTFKKTVSFVR